MAVASSTQQVPTEVASDSATEVKRDSLAGAGGKGRKRGWRGEGQREGERQMTGEKDSKLWDC